MGYEFREPFVYLIILLWGYNTITSVQYTPSDVHLLSLHFYIRLYEERPKCSYLRLILYIHEVTAQQGSMFVWIVIRWYHLCEI